MALGSIPMTKGCAFRILERDPADGKYRFQLTTPSKVYVLSADTADEMMKVYLRCAHCVCVCVCV